MFTWNKTKIKKPNPAEQIEFLKRTIKNIITETHGSEKAAIEIALLEKQLAALKDKNDKNQR